MLCTHTAGIDTQVFTGAGTGAGTGTTSIPLR